MQGIASLVTALLTQAQQILLPAILVLAISVGGYQYMLGDSKAAKVWIIGGLIGAAIVLSATAIAGIVRSAVGGGA